MSTNPDDWWRHQQSAKPHDTPHDPVTPGMPLTDPGFEPQFQSVQVSPGGGGTSGFGIFIFVFIFGAPIFGSLYPLAAGTALAAGLATNAFLHTAMPGLDPAGRGAFALLAGLIVFWPACRLDGRMGAVLPPYRWLRHALRLFLVAAMLTGPTFRVPDGGSYLQFFVMRLVGALANPFALGIVALIAHYLITRQGLREWWHHGLEILRLRQWNLA
jgi:hypothetical protein